MMGLFVFIFAFWLQILPIISLPVINDIHNVNHHKLTIRPLLVLAPTRPTANTATSTSLTRARKYSQTPTTAKAYNGNQRDYHSRKTHHDIAQNSHPSHHVNHEPWSRYFHWSTHATPQTQDTIEYSPFSNLEKLQEIATMGIANYNNASIVPNYYFESLINNRRISATIHKFNETVHMFLRPTSIMNEQDEVQQKLVSLVEGVDIRPAVEVATMDSFFDLDSGIKEFKHYLHHRHPSSYGSYSSSYDSHYSYDSYSHSYDSDVAQDQDQEQVTQEVTPEAVSLIFHIQRELNTLTKRSNISRVVVHSLGTDIESRILTTLCGQYLESKMGRQNVTILLWRNLFFDLEPESTPFIRLPKHTSLSPSQSQQDTTHQDTTTKEDVMDALVVDVMLLESAGTLRYETRELAEESYYNPVQRQESRNVYIIHLIREAERIWGLDFQLGRDDARVARVMYNAQRNLKRLFVDWEDRASDEGDIQ